MFSKSLLFVLIGILGHLPMPWIHNHAGLQQASLQEHLQAYHAGTSSNPDPRGWHLHWFSPVAKSPTEDRAATLEIPASDRYVELLRLSLNSAQLLDQPQVSSGSFASQQLTARTLSPPECQRFGFLCVLRI